MSKLQKGTYEKYGVKYDTLTLVDGEYSFTVVPKKGGMAMSFKHNDDEYLWLRDKNFESTDRTRCGVPILFPNCGMPKDGVHIFDGKAYPIENHGFADLLPWNVESADDEKIVLTLEPNGLTKFVYPFDFKLAITYTLNTNKASLSLKVENTDTKDLPYSVGFHPYFNVSDLDNVTFDIKADQMNGEVAPENIDLPHNVGGDQNTRVLSGVKSPMILKDSVLNHTVRLDFTEDFTNGILWEQEAEKFVAMEPWNGCANSVNEEGKHEVLPSGSSKNFDWSITID